MTAPDMPAGRDRPPDRLARRLRPYGPDLAVILFFLFSAAVLTHGLWPDAAGRVLALNPEDQTLVEWFLANDARILLGDFGLVSDRLNAPDGFNLLANATIILPGAVLAPITLLVGAPVSFAILLAGNLALTAIAWYLLYTRTLGTHRAAAAIGAGFCGFAPGMVSQSNSHLHITAQWLVPAMVWCVVRMVRLADPQRRGGTSTAATRGLVAAAVTLAGLVTAQVFVGEEVLLLTAVTLGLITIGYAAASPALARRVLPRLGAGLLLAAGLAAAALAVPLWVQLKGPQSVPNGVFNPDYFSADLASFPAISPLSAMGSAEASRLSTGAAEYNTFLGAPLLLVTLACAGWLWRRPLVIALMLAGIGSAWLSLGPSVVINRTRTGIWAPYELLRGMPVVEGALPMRFALALIPIIATVLVLAVDRALRSGKGGSRVLVPAAVVIALLPVVPAPLPVTSRAPVPAFIADGHWRECVPANGVLVPVPLPRPKEPHAMRWATAVDAAFRLPEGFFIGPYGPNGRASIGAGHRPTSLLLLTVAKTGQVPSITAQHREQAARDFAFWGASCVALAESEPHAEELRAVLEALLGPGVRVADAWTWRL
jgi:hypothetical protein